MKKIVAFLPAAAIAMMLLQGCATGYAEENRLLLRPSGYSEVRGPGQLIKVQYKGDPYTTIYEAKVYALYRCAEIAARDGKPYFALYLDLPAALADRRSADNTASAVLGIPSSFAYIALHDAPGPGLLSAAEVMQRLAPRVKGAKR